MSQQRASALKSEFLERRPSEEQQLVFKVTSQLGGPLTRWMESYPTMRERTKRVPQICLTLAAADPRCDVNAMQPCARLVAWVFAVDDLLDEGKVPLDQVAAFRKQCIMALEDKEGADRNEEWVPLCQALREIRDDLVKLPGSRFSEFQGDWVLSIEQMLEAMENELRWSQHMRSLPDVPLPGYATYVENGHRSISVSPVFLGALMAMDKKDVPALSTRLRELEKKAATCVRLANDLRSYEKEVAEGKLNSLTVLQREWMDRKKFMDPAAALEQARTFIQTAIKEGLEGGAKDVRDGPNPSGRAELFLLRIAGFACDFYVHHDYDHALSRGNG
jgi:Terpene synthase family 2, C-terminal metal binding